MVDEGTKSVVSGKDECNKNAKVVSYQNRLRVHAYSYKKIEYTIDNYNRLF